MKKALLALSLLFFCNIAIANDGMYHIKKTYHFNKRPVIVNAVIIEPHSNYSLKLSYGKKFISTLQRVKFFAQQERAYAAINASFFKPDTGAPLGLSIMDKRLITGPLFQRSAFGVTTRGKYKIAKVNLVGSVNINRSKIKLENINQPIMSQKGLYLFNSCWGKSTPKTKKNYSHIVVRNHKIDYITDNSTHIPFNGYVLVGHNSIFKKNLTPRTSVKYKFKLYPKGWEKMKYAFAAGPYLVKDGKRLIDKQRFSKLFLWTKAPRSALGIRKDGGVILLTADGRHKGVSEGVTLTELADIMLKFNAHQAMNLDGGSSTQMFYNNKLINRPSNIVGARVTNSLVVVKKGY